MDPGDLELFKIKGSWTWYLIMYLVPPWGITVYIALSTVDSGGRVPPPGIQGTPPWYRASGELSHGDQCLLAGRHRYPGTSHGG